MVTTHQREQMSRNDRDLYETSNGRKETRNFLITLIVLAAVAVLAYAIYEANDTTEMEAANTAPVTVDDRVDMGTGATTGIER